MTTACHRDTNSVTGMFETGMNSKEVESLGLLKISTMASYRLNSAVFGLAEGKTFIT